MRGLNQLPHNVFRVFSSLFTSTYVVECSVVLRLSTTSPARIAVWKSTRQARYHERFRNSHRKWSGSKEVRGNQLYAHENKTYFVSCIRGTQVVLLASKGATKVLVSRKRPVSFSVRWLGKRCLWAGNRVNTFRLMSYTRRIIFIPWILLSGSETSSRIPARKCCPSTGKLQTPVQYEQKDDIFVCTLLFYKETGGSPRQSRPHYAG